MKSISFGEASARYELSRQEDPEMQEPVVVESDGEPIGVLISLADYRAFRAWQIVRGNPAYRLPADFAREVAAFERLRPDLLREYGGRVVAIRGERVVADGTDPLEVLDDVERRLGPGAVYVEWVEEASPRTMRVPSAWVKK